MADGADDATVEIRHVAELDPATLADAYAIDAGAAFGRGGDVALVREFGALRERLFHAVMNAGAPFKSRLGLSHVVEPATGRTLAVHVAFDIAGHVFLLSPPAAHDIAESLRGWAGSLAAADVSAAKGMADMLDGRAEIATRHETGATVQ